MNVKFKLKEPDSSRPTLILLKVYFNGQRFTYSTRQKIDPKFWNDAKMRTRKARGYSSQYANLDIWLDSLETELKKAVLNIKNHGRIPLIEEMKEALDIFTNRKSIEEQASLFSFINSFIQERKANPRYSSGTTKNYVTHFNNLKEFAKERGCEIGFDDINRDFFNGLLAFYTKKGHSENHKHKQIQTLKVFLNEAVERGFTSNLNHNKKWFKVKREKIQNFSLEYQELMDLYDLNLSSHQRLDRIRDLFLIGCFTGLRFSDFSELKTTNIQPKDDGREYFIIRTAKTKEYLEIPINGYVKDILLKYNMSPPRAVSNQKMNQYLKELFKLAGLSRIVTITRYDQQGKLYEASEPISSVITTHTARRSFATIAYKFGVNSLDIMQITGHKKESTFLKYINITKEDTAKRLAKNPFFSLDSK